MAEADITLQASNIFGLSSAFKTQSSSTSEVTTNPTAMDEYGNNTCEDVIEDITNYTQSATCCKANLKSELGTFLTKFGDVQNGKLVTGLTINMTAADYCTVEITGHNHAVNPHVAGVSVGYADVSDFLPAESFFEWIGFGVPDFGVTVGSDANQSSATVSFSVNHIDVQKEDGSHLVGKNITPRCELSMDFSGIPTSNDISAIQSDLRTNVGTMLNAFVDSVDFNDSNSEFDTFSFTAHAHTSIVTA